MTHIFILYFLSVSERTLTTTEIGTAKRTPMKPKTTPPITIHRNTTSGLTPSVLFMTNGVRTLFSVRCVRPNTMSTAMIPGQPSAIAATRIAGIEPIIGQIYGKIFVIPAMSASEPVLGIFMPNKPTRFSKMNTMSAIYPQTISCPLSRKPSFA